MNQSNRINRAFDAACNLMSETVGIPVHVAMNVIRYQKSLKKNAKPKSVWADPKTGLALTQNQWTGPALRLANKIANGTASGMPLAYGDYKNDFENMNKHNCGYWTRDEFNTATHYDLQFSAFIKSLKTDERN